MVIYQTEVVGFGELASDFALDKTFITFANDIPNELQEYCYYVKPVEMSAKVKVGDKLQVDSKHFTITAVGSVANKNIQEFGHACYKFNGHKEEELPGTINLEVSDVPKIEIGTIIRIITSGDKSESDVLNKKKE